MIRRNLWTVCLLCVLLVWGRHTGAQRALETTGLIAYIGLDGNVYTFDPVTQQTQAITDDANREAGQPEAGESTQRTYRWPTWSADGRLAYFATVADFVGSTLRDFRAEAWVASDGQPGRLVYSGQREVFNYAYWSPGTCADVPDCRDLAVLLTGARIQGLQVTLVRDAAEPSERVVGSGPSAFYFSWNDDGSQMFWRRDGRLDIYNVEGDTSTQLQALPGQFAVPDWSPVDERVLVVTANDDGDRLDVLRDGAVERTLVSSLGGATTFAWSPDGNQVAYVSDQGRLQVVAAADGGAVVEGGTGGVLAFFWSPDGSRIAYVTLSSQPGSFSVSRGVSGVGGTLAQGLPGLVWTVLDVATGEETRSGSFLPTPDMIYLFSYFDQFAQSHALWSPDSRYLVYGEVTADNRSTVSVLDATQSSSVVPLAVAEGTLGIWSFHTGQP